MRFHAAAAVLIFLSTVAWGQTEEKVAAATAQAAPLAPNEWHGTVGCSKCDFGDKASAEECIAALKTSEALYLLKPALTAPPAVKEFLIRIRLQEMKGEYLCKGEVSELDGKKWLAVTSMVAKPLAKAAAAATALTFSTNRKRPATGAAATQGGAGGGDDGGGAGGGEGGRKGRGRRHQHADEGGGGEEGQ